MAQRVAPVRKINQLRHDANSRRRHSVVQLNGIGGIVAGGEHPSGVADPVFFEPRLKQKAEALPAFLEAQFVGDYPFYGCDIERASVMGGEEYAVEVEADRHLRSSRGGAGAIVKPEPGDDGDRMTDGAMSRTSHPRWSKALRSAEMPM